MDSTYVNTFDYSDGNRERTINFLFDEAKNARSVREEKWKLLDGLYRSFEDAIKQCDVDAEGNLNENLNDGDKQYKLNDPFIQVESQINPDIPEVLFRGRDNRQDTAKAKQRQYVVRYLLESNKVKAKNSALARSVGILGDGFYKVYYNEHKIFADNLRGDICIDPISVEDIFPDPTADCIADCEYIDHPYYLHKQKAKRLFGDLFRKKGINLDELVTESQSSTREVTGNDSNVADANLVQILEHWYRDEEGDIALSMLVNGKEFNHIKKYWKNTRSQNKRFPFVQFWGTRALKGFWNISDLEVISPLVEIGNTMLNAGLKNMELMSNDVIIRQEGDGDEDELVNEPGAQWTYKKGQAPPQRAGGLNPMDKFWANIEQVEKRIQRTLRNYDLNMGQEPNRVTTASGIAQLRADQAGQANKKDYDPLQSWKELFELIDWSALEFFDTDKMIFIGVPKRQGKTIEASGEENLDPANGDIFFKFNSESIRQEVPSVDPLTGDIASEATEYYYPTVDTEVVPSNSAESNQIINNLLQIAALQPTVTNYKIIIMAIEQLNIPQKQDIINQILEIYEPQPIEGLTEEEQQIVSRLPPEQQALIRQRPDLLRLAMQAGGQAEAQTPTGNQTVRSDIPSAPQAPNVRYAGIA